MAPIPRGQRVSLYPSSIGSVGFHEVFCSQPGRSSAASRPLRYIEVLRRQRDEALLEDAPRERLLLIPSIQKPLPEPNSDPYLGIPREIWNWAASPKRRGFL